MNQQILNTDKPITNSKEDFLGRKDFSDAVSNAIINYTKDEESLTLGLYGKWGSGKTSIVNMIVEEIEKEEDIIIFNFQPWIYSDTEQLISHFFREFSKKVKHEDNASIAIRLGNDLETYASFFEPLALIPEPTISFVGTATSKVFGGVGKASKKWGKLKSKDLSGTKNSIEEHIRNMNKKLVIVIDDIDRLNNTEIRQVFQMIKVLGNFPNTIYLTSMDREVVTDALSEVQKGDGNEYLEKIINVPFEVPMPSINKLHNFLFAELDMIIGKDNDFDQDYFSSVFRSGYKDFFKNIRDINRYINILRFNYSIVKDEIDIVDLFVITAFQVFEPKVYEYLKYNKNIVLLTEYYSKEEDKAKAISNFKEVSSRLLLKLSEDNFWELIGDLFPGMSEYGFVDQEKCTKMGRICSPDFYNLYFQMSLNEDEIGKYEMSQYINSTLDENKFRTTIHSLIESKRTDKFLERLLSYIKHDRLAKTQTQIICNVLTDLGDTFPKEKDIFFFSIKIELIIAELIKHFDKDVRFSIIKESIEKSKSSIAIPCNIVIGYMIEHGEFAEYKDQSKPKELRSISQENLDDLKKIIQLKIEEKADKKSLHNSNDFRIILYLWKKLDEKKLEIYVHVLIGTDKGLVSLLKEYVGERHSSRSGKTLIFNYKDIHTIVEPERIIENVKNIVDKKELDLSEKEQFALENFLKSYNKNEDDNI